MSYKSDGSSCQNTRLPWKVAKTLTKYASVDGETNPPTLVFENPIEVNDGLKISSLPLNSIEDVFVENSYSLINIQNFFSISLGQIVYLHVSFIANSAITGSQSIFSLKENFRPNHTCTFTGASPSYGVRVITIQTDGQVKPYNNINSGEYVDINLFITPGN